MSELLLVTGASGYIAGQLIPRLLEKGYRVRCLARDPQTLASRSWARSVEIQGRDLLRPETLPAALEGVRAAYYLIHSMASGKNYPECDLLAARNFARAAQEAHLEHIIYLGGLVDPERPLSLHMRSRVETGEALRSAMHAAIQALSPAATELLYHPLRPVQTPKQDGFLLDIRQTRINAAPEAVFNLLAALGGRNGWLFANPLWRLRAALDRLAGGPGMRGRPEVLAPGAAVDFYRVEVYDPPRQLRLRAELKAPGEGWMEWRLEPDGAGTHLMQIAWFAPRGVPGFLYWYLLGPVHRWVFAGMLRAIAKAVER
jgi:uncharacterized protein YndB with AHSA1/START domain